MIYNILLKINILSLYLFHKSYLTKLMNEDMTRKINNIKTPEDEAEIEEYENGVMEVKNQSVGLSINNCVYGIFVIFNLFIGKIRC